MLSIFLTLWNFLMKSLVSLSCFSISSLSSSLSSLLCYYDIHWCWGLCFSLLLGLICSCFSFSYLIIWLRFLGDNLFTSWCSDWCRSFWRSKLFHILFWYHHRWCLVIVFFASTEDPGWLPLGVSIEEQLSSGSSRFPTVYTSPDPQSPLKNQVSV